MAAVGEGREQLGVLLAALEQVVAGDEAVGRAGQAPVALEAGPDQGLVGQVVAGEHRGDALVERGLRQRAGGREEAEDGPLDAVGQRDRGRGLGPPGRPSHQRPGSISTSRRWSGRAISSRTSDEEPVDGVRRRLAGRGDPDDPAACVRWRADRAVGTAAGPGASVSRAEPVAGPSAVAGLGRGRPGSTGRSGGRPRGRVGSAVASRRSWPARSRPTRISPNSRSYRAGSPRARSVSTAVSVTVRGGLGRRERALVEALRRRRTGRGPGTRSGSPEPPGTGGSDDVGPRPRRRAARRAPGRQRARPTRRPRRRRPASRALDEAIAGAGAAEHGRGERLRAAVDEQDARPSRAIAGATASSDRPIATACQLHGARSEEPASASIGSSDGRLAARGPRTSRGRRPPAAPGSGRTGGWPSTRRMRGAGAPRPPAPRARRSGRAGRTGSTSARTAVAVPSPRLRRSSPRRAWSGPSAPPSRRWTKPRTSRNASSNASHGLRSRHWVAAGRRTCPPAMRRLRDAPGRASRGGWPAGSCGGTRAGARPGPGRRAGRSRSDR